MNATTVQVARCTAGLGAYDAEMALKRALATADQQTARAVRQALRSLRKLDPFFAATAAQPDRRTA
jgi:hypothetical protein